MSASAENEGNILGILSGINVTEGGEQQYWKELNNKLREDQSLKAAIQSLVDRGINTLEAVSNTVSHLPVRGREVSYTDSNGTERTYIAVAHEKGVLHTMPAKPQIPNSETIGNSLGFMKELASYSGVDIKALDAAGATLQRHTQGKTEQQLKTDPNFNAAYATFCAAQHQKVAEYHEKHQKFFAAQAKIDGPNKKYFQQMYALATRNMEVAKNDAAINMNIAGQWQEHGKAQTRTQSQTRAPAQSSVVSDRGTSGAPAAPTAELMERLAAQQQKVEQAKPAAAAPVVAATTPVVAATTAAVPPPPPPPTQPVLQTALFGRV